MSDPGTTATPIQRREIIVRGNSDGGHGLEAHIYEEVDNLHVAHAYFLEGGYDVEIPEPDKHNPGPGGDTFVSATHPLFAAHAASLAARGITDIPAHVRGLKEQRAGK